MGAKRILHKARKLVKRVVHRKKTKIAVARMMRIREISASLLTERKINICKDIDEIQTLINAGGYGSSTNPKAIREIISNYDLLLASLRATKAKYSSRKELRTFGMKLLLYSDKQLKAALQWLTPSLPQKESEILNKKWKAYTAYAKSVIAKERRKADFAFEFARLSNKHVVLHASEAIKTEANSRKNLIHKLRESIQGSN